MTRVRTSFLRVIVACYVACSGVLGGCLHAPLEGVSGGIVEIENLHIWDYEGPFVNSGKLTGVAIGEHEVLTAGHAFLYDPEPGHPLKLNGVDADYTILVDGLSGHRNKREFGDKIFTGEQYRQDYLILETKRSFDECVIFVPFSKERLGEIRHLTLVTRTKRDGELVTIPLKRILFHSDDLLMVKFAESRVDRYMMSGSPIYGTYSDGSVVLIGLANGTGKYTDRLLGVPVWEGECLIVVPAWRIPFEVVDRE